jgi:pimeloyl-ACP methyl ester carboxylesterase
MVPVAGLLQFSAINDLAPRCAILSSHSFIGLYLGKWRTDLLFSNLGREMGSMKQWAVLAALVAVFLASPLHAQSTPAGDKPAEAIRPQTPRPPFPYQVQDVTYDNAGAHVRLAGILTLPPGKGRHPAVLLVPGSGPTDRDTTAFRGHKLFMVLADALTQRGIAVLRVDKRGIGASSGNYATATTADFASDMEAGIRYLRSRPDIDPKQVGVIGHSEGASIAALIASHDRSIPWMVMMAGNGLSTVDFSLAGQQHREEATGVESAQIDRDIDLYRKIYATVKDEPDPVVREARLNTLLKDAGAETVGRLALSTKSFMTPWMYWAVAYDPGATLRDIRCPVLALIGTKDLIVTPAENLPALRAALAQNSKADIETVPGVNHMFQTANTGLPQEWPNISETIAPSALNRIADWVVQQSHLASKHR